MNTIEVLRELRAKNFSKQILTEAIKITSEKDFMPIFEYAEELCEENFGKDVYIRGIVEFTNNCRKNCNYCGIRRENMQVTRYRVTGHEILSSVKNMFEQGVKTVVLQGGEDVKIDDDLLLIIQSIRSSYDMAITISIGERTAEVYRKFKEAGSDRFLLRIETTDKNLFKQLHPDDNFEERMQCLETLKKLKFEVGTGVMLGLPGQSFASIAGDLLFFKEFMPEMIGLGPFIPHTLTPMAMEKGGNLFLTLKTLALSRILLPKVNIPATTAMGTADPKGRQKALMYGANVIMPNYTPIKYREKYMLYDKKICVSEMCTRFCTDKITSEAGKKIIDSKGFSKLANQ